MEYFVARFYYEQLKNSENKNFEMILNFKVLKGEDQTNNESDVLNFLV